MKERILEQAEVDSLRNHPEESVRSLAEEVSEWRWNSLLMKDLRMKHARYIMQGSVLGVAALVVIILLLWISG